MTTPQKPGAPCDLLGRVLWHEPGAWPRLVSLCAPQVYAWLRQGGLTPGEAVDAGHTAFARLAQTLHTFRPDHGTFCAWLRGLTRRQLQEHRSRQQTQDTPVIGGSNAPPTPSPTPANGPVCPLLLARALDLLQPEFEATHWQAFQRLAVEGQSAAAAAAELRLSAADVYLAQARILCRLRQEFENLIDL